MTNHSLINKSHSLSNLTASRAPCKTKSKPIAKKRAPPRKKILFKIEKVQRVIAKKSLRNVLEEKAESNLSTWDGSTASVVMGYTRSTQNTFLSCSDQRSASTLSSMYLNTAKNLCELNCPIFGQTDTFMQMAKSQHPRYSKNIMNNLNQQNQHSNNNSFDPYVT